MTRDANATCPTCGYGLMQLPAAGRCPECGGRYDGDLLSPSAPRPPLGWAILLVPPLATVLAIPLLVSLGYLLGTAVALIFLACCWHATRRVAAWQYDLRLRRFRQGTRPKPAVQFRPLLHQFLFVGEIGAVVGLWALMSALVKLI